MNGSQLVVSFVVFAVTLVDHSAVPNIFVLSMVAAKGKGFNPTTLFLMAAMSIVLYEQVAFWLGRFTRSYFFKSRLISRLGAGAAMVAGLVARRAGTWMMWGRFVGGVGLYIPFAYGQTGKSYVGFCVWSLLGTLFHLGIFGIPAYWLGARFESVIARIPLGVISVGVFLVVMAFFLWRRFRRHDPPKGASAQ